MQLVGGGWWWLDGWMGVCAMHARQVGQPARAKQAQAQQALQAQQAQQAQRAHQLLDAAHLAVGLGALLRPPLRDLALELVAQVDAQLDEILGQIGGAGCRAGRGRAGQVGEAGRGL